MLIPADELIAAPLIVVPAVLTTVPGAMKNQRLILQPGGLHRFVVDLRPQARINVVQLFACAPIGETL